MLVLIWRSSVSTPVQLCSVKSCLNAASQTCHHYIHIMCMCKVAVPRQPTNAQPIASCPYAICSSLYVVIFCVVNTLNVHKIEMEDYNWRAHELVSIKKIFSTANLHVSPCVQFIRIYLLLAFDWITPEHICCHITSAFWFLRITCFITCYGSVCSIFLWRSVGVPLLLTMSVTLRN